MKIMAIDYGDAHTGIAISDYTETLAGHSEVLHSRKQEEVLAGIRRLIAEHDVKLLVLGYPRNMDGSEGPRAGEVRRLPGAAAAGEGAGGHPLGRAAHHHRRPQYPVPERAECQKAEKRPWMRWRRR